MTGQAEGRSPFQVARAASIREQSASSLVLLGERRYFSAEGVQGVRWRWSMMRPSKGLEGHDYEFRLPPKGNAVTDGS